MCELTELWEDHIEKSHERKLPEYQDLVLEYRHKGWRACCEPVELGCKSFIGRSLNKILINLGLTGNKRRNAIRK